MADLAHQTAHRMPIVSGNSTLFGHVAAAHAAARVGTAEARLQRLATTLNESPRVQALQRVGAMLSEPVSRRAHVRDSRAEADHGERAGAARQLQRMPAGATVVQRNGGRFILYVPAHGDDGPERVGRDVENDLSRIEGGNDLLQSLHPELEGENLVVHAADFDALQDQLDTVTQGRVAIRRSPAQIGQDLPRHTVDTMRAINKANTVSYPYNFSQEDFDRAQEYFAGVGYQGNLVEAQTGFADPRYFEKTARFTWVLRPEVSAAIAIESFVNLASEYPIIAECQTTAQAVEYYAILKSVGRRRFDAKLGSEAVLIPEDQRLRLQFSLDPANPIKQLYQSPQLDFDAEEQAGLRRDDDGNLVSEANFRAAKRGGRYFIQGPADYVKRHPDGFLRGENAFYYGADEGGQRFGGLGIENATELGITGILAEAFNAAPTESETASKRGRLSQPELASDLHQDVLPPELQASAQSLDSVHRASDLRDLAEALNDQPVENSPVNDGAVWKLGEGVFEMDRTACVDKGNKIKKVTLHTLTKVFADTFGLEFSPGLVAAVRALNPDEIGDKSHNTLLTITRCSYPDPANLVRLKKGTGFQATSALILDPAKIHTAFF